MSIFGSIMSKIFGHEAAATKLDAPASPVAGTHSSQASAPSSEPSAAVQQPVDVAAVLTNLASKNSQQLNWRTSIVDLMKLLELDSSLNARKELSTELHYSGDMNDSAAMNYGFTSK
jgi:Domain of unknown function (DUF3597)